MLIALAATAPTAMHSSVRQYTKSGIAFCSCTVGMSVGPHLVPATVARAAPARSRTRQETKTPRPAHTRTILRSVVGGRHRVESAAAGFCPAAEPTRAVTQIVKR